MTILISGGCKNGKSTIAEDCCVALADGGPLYYLATMKAFEEEDYNRIARHRASRAGKGFQTIEQPLHIDKAADGVDAANGTFILDSVTALMINELYSFPEEGEEFQDFGADPEAGERVASELVALCKKVKNIVFVSDYIYSEADAYNKYTDEFLRALATADKALAKYCDAVAEVCLGNINMLKGSLPI